MHRLILVAHPALHRSRINAHLTSVAMEQPDTEVVNLYDTYPDFDIDVAAEQERLRRADAIILQHPLYWYSIPALLKEWIDLVFEHGFAYGSDSYHLAGKLLCQAISTGGDEASFGPEGFNRFTINELTQPIQATAHFCQMKWCPPFLTHGGHVITEEEITVAAERYQRWINELTIPQ